jgi:catechol 2,3-dioxygenase-like lactoylglutathione lyase family enzyme
MNVPHKNDTPVFLGIHHVALNVVDVSAAERFYTNAASMHAWSAGDALNLPGAGRYLSSKNMALRLLPANAEAPLVRYPVSAAGITHVCFQTPDIALVYQNFATSRASFHCTPIDLGTGFLYTYARDPEHNVSEIECVPPVWTDAAPWLAHVNIASADLDRAIGFYSALLGKTAATSPRLRRNARLDAIANLENVDLRMAWIAAGNAQIELMQYANPATRIGERSADTNAPGYVHIAFEVSDLEMALAHLRACGGEVHEPRLPSAMSSIADCRDPDGNRLLLMELDSNIAAIAGIASFPEPNIVDRFNAARHALLESA